MDVPLGQPTPPAYPRAEPPVVIGGPFVPQQFAPVVGPAAPGGPFASGPAPSVPEVLGASAMPGLTPPPSQGTVL
eukprot:9844920-Alexandrium_andersonii.AAC.1